MFYLVAESAHPRFKGEVARRPFETLEAAEALMRTWARFGVENLCDEADRICVYDADGHVQSVWSRRLRAPVRSAEGSAQETPHGPVSKALEA